MKYCTHCGKELMAEAVVCPGCGCAVAPMKAVADDSVSVGLCILAFLFPIVGFIYWGVKTKECPNKAQACGVTALISWLMSILISVICFGYLYSSIFSWIF